MDRCKFNGCGKPALFALKYRVPIQGLKEKDHRPIDIVIIMELCRRHANEAKLVDFDQPATREYVRQQAAIRHMPADFSRARLVVIKIADAEFQAVVKSAATQARARDFAEQQADSKFPVH